MVNINDNYFGMKIVLLFGNAIFGLLADIKGVPDNVHSIYDYTELM